MATVSRAKRLREYRDGGGTTMRRSIWIVVSMLTMHTAGILHAQAQQDRIYPTGEFVLLWRNATTPQRFIEVNRERTRVNINYADERIQFALIMRATDGNYYAFHGGTGDRPMYSPRDGWVVAHFNIPLLEYSRLHTIVVRDWLRLPPNRRTTVDIRWYRFEKSRVDRETRKTATVSPPIDYQRDGMTHIRYYLVDITESGLSGGATRREGSLSSGGILAPIIHIRWVDQKGRSRSYWIGEPLPGKNDCVRRDRQGNCIEQQSDPSDATYNQYYEERAWIYSRFFMASVFNPQYPICYPVYVFRNLGVLHNSGHSDRGLTADPFPQYNIAYGTSRWWRVHQATIWENVPYEWGGKFYGARASGRRHGYNRNGAGTTLGFGLDCSGLVAVAKDNYGNANYGTGAIMNETTWLGETDRRTGERRHYWNRLRPGDVVIKRGHVMMVCRTEHYRVYVIEAVGVTGSEITSDDEKVRYWYYSFSYLDQKGYEPRAFND